MLWRPADDFFTEFILIFVYVGAGLSCTGEKVTTRTTKLYGFYFHAFMYLHHTLGYINVENFYKKRILWEKYNCLLFKNKTKMHKIIWHLARFYAFSALSETLWKNQSQRLVIKLFNPRIWMTRPLTNANRNSSLLSVILVAYSKIFQES